MSNPTYRKILDGILKVGSTSIDAFKVGELANNCGGAVKSGSSMVVKFTFAGVKYKAWPSGWGKNNTKLTVIENCGRGWW